jgi:hypothetical protein
MKDIVLGIGRHLLTIAGGALVARGSIGADEAQVLVGSGVALLGVALSVITKLLSKKDA